METFSALLAICAGNSPGTVEYPTQGQWRGAFMFSFIYARINGWVNTGEAGDLRRHQSHLWRHCYEMEIIDDSKVAIIPLLVKLSPLKSSQ